VENKVATPSREESQPIAHAAPSPFTVAGISALLLFGYLVVAYVLRLTADIELPRWSTLVALFAIIHICARHFAKRVGRRLETKDLSSLSTGCAIAFALIDEGSTLALRWTGYVTDPWEYPIATAVGAVTADALIVVAMVFLTVPLAGKLYGRDKHA
jgi:hypothetical protein